MKLFCEFTRKSNYFQYLNKSLDCVDRNLSIDTLVFWHFFRKQILNLPVPDMIYAGFAQLLRHSMLLHCHDLNLVDLN